MRIAQPVSLFEEWSARHPDWSDERVVRAIARRLVAQGEVRPPVDVELLASLCGIVDVEYRVRGPSGILVRREGGWVASVLAGDGRERQRFTILHEGGHTLLPGFGRGREYRCKGPRTRAEQLCDIAAAEMLLPAAFFRDDLAAAPFGLPTVEELSGVYEASVQATALRAVDLSGAPAMLLVLHRTHKPAERGREASCQPKLRLEWAHSSGVWPYPLRHKSVDEHSVLERAWEEPIRERRAEIDELLAQPAGRVELSAGRYGDKLLALVRRPPGRRPRR